MTESKTRQARDLAERALEEAAQGHEDEAKRLARKATKLAPKAAQDVAEEVEEERAQTEKYAKTS
jgi:uncharacterized protein YutE (UPF0331/DUF86 family)